jgi:ribonuclease E
VSDAEPDRVVEDFEAEPAETAHPGAPQEVSESMNADATEASSSETTAAAAPAPVEPPDLPRRRSTVREPAPGAGSNVVPTPAPEEPAPPPEQPTAAEPPESEATGRPRRTGWWSRRIAGG